MKKYNCIVLKVRARIILPLRRQYQNFIFDFIYLENQYFKRIQFFIHLYDSGKLKLIPFLLCENQQIFQKFRFFIPFEKIEDILIKQIQIKKEPFSAFQCIKLQ